LGNKFKQNVFSCIRVCILVFETIPVIVKSVYSLCVQVKQRAIDSCLTLFQAKFKPKVVFKKNPQNNLRCGALPKTHNLSPWSKPKTTLKTTEFKIQLKPKNTKYTKDFINAQKHKKINFTKKKSYFAGKTLFWFQISKISRTKTMHFVRLMLGSSKRKVSQP